jgi:mRNA-degrading endonuclease RelE of RelBE toxin-antitoxin system
MAEGRPVPCGGRLRCEVYRVLYEIHADVLVVYVVKVGYRMDV